MIANLNENLGLAIMHKYNDLMKNVLKLILALVFTNTIVAQIEPNDCVNAIIVCGNGSFTSNASGSGNTQEINACGGLESNSIWLEINIVQAGTLGFNLIPDDPSVTVDYDFWVFGPNAVCGALGAPIRCATTNPQQAGMTNNLTGMYGSTLLTQTGPGASGNGYVRWLNVLPGQSYYIAIDRPAGDGGFQLQWIGSAMTGTGAFTSPPPANAIPDVLTCSNTPNIGIYNLDTVRPLINADTTNNIISFHTTLANAIDNVNPLPDIYANTSNPQTIYVRVTDIVSGCSSTTEFDLVVNLVPNASVSISSTSICAGESVTTTFSGTPNATFSYTINGGVTQTAVLDPLGIFTLTQSPTANTTYTLTGVRILDGSGATICFQPLNQSVSVTVNPLPTVTLSGTTTICSGATAVISFNGTPNATVTYTVDGGANQTIVLDGSGLASLTTPALTVSSTYDLVSVASSGTPVCSQSQTGSAIITVVNLPTATISGTTSICSGSTTVISFSGTPNATVTYTINGGSNQTIVLDGTGAANFTTPALIANTTYDLVGAATSGVPSCSQAQTGSAIVTISATPTATISGTTTICSGSTAVITFNGTPNATVTYTVNGGVNETIVLNSLGSATLTTPALISNSVYTLVSVALSGTPPCSQAQTGIATVTVLQLPTATISGAITICSSNSAVISFNGTPNATVTYTVDGGANQITVLDGTGLASLTTPILTVSSTYVLVSVSLPGAITCLQNLSESAVVTVNPLPVITNVPSNITVCSGDTLATNAFVSLPAGANFTWTNSNPSIGLAASGTGNIPNFGAFNNGPSVTATINITATLNNCATSGSYNITVNPVPVPNPIISDYELCDYNSTGDEIEVFT
uniref:beta strand repeat-containing protein n=1 Tax=Flavobacterium sp. UBA7682 TaxID=1946560 RepID=UPI0039C85C9B